MVRFKIILAIYYFTRAYVCSYIYVSKQDVCTIKVCMYFVESDETEIEQNSSAVYIATVI